MTLTIFRKEGIQVSVIQSSIVQGDKERNWARMMSLFDIAMAGRPQLVVLPEAFVSGVNFIVLRQMAEPIPGGATCEKLQGLARERQVHIVAGILESGDDRKIYDSAILIDPSGKLVATYRRRFLWVGERSMISQGTGPLVIDTAIGRLSLIVGYDICFPEACGHALAEEVDAIVCPASVFHPLSINVANVAAARAMDHHCYVVYANCIGFHQFANMQYGGQSGIHGDPYFHHIQLGWTSAEAAAPLAFARDAEEVITAELFVSSLAAARRHKLPFRADASATLSTRGS